MPRSFNVVRWLTALCGALACAAPAWAQPVNDDFASRTVIGDASPLLQGNTLGSTTEPGEFLWNTAAYDAVSGTIWWGWTAPADGTLHLTVTNRQSQPHVTVFTGDTLSNLVVVASNLANSSRSPIGNFSDNFTKALILPVQAGTEYSFSFRQISPFLTTYYSSLTVTQRHAMTLGVDFTTLRIADPTNGQFFTQPNEIPLTVSPVNPLYDGTLERVDYYANSNRIATATNAPYTAVWSNPPLGVFTLSARATNSAGVTRQSQPVSIHVRPANDDFTNATLMQGERFTFVGNNVLATHEPGEPAVAPTTAGATVWFRWTAPADGDLTLSSSLPRRIAMAGYQGEAVDALTLVSSNVFRASGDDSRSCGGLWLAHSRLVTRVRVGQTYHFSMDTAEPAPYYLYLPGGALQPFNVQGSFVPTPSNDDFAQPSALSGAAFALSVSNYGASLQPGELSASYAPGGRSTWYRWTAPWSGTVRISDARLRPYAFPTFVTNSFGIPPWYWPNYSPFPPIFFQNSTNGLFILSISRCDRQYLVNPRVFPVFAAYTGNNLASLTEQGSGVSFEFFAQAGQTYSMCVDANLGTAMSTTLNLDLAPRPPNDQFTNCIRLPSEGAYVTAYNASATQEPGEPAMIHDDTSGHTVWWSWTAPNHGTVTVDLGQSERPFPLAVFTGASVGSLTLLASGRGSAQFYAEPGRTYHIAVGSDAGRTGRVNMWVRPAFSWLTGSAWERAGPGYLLSFPATNALSGILQVGFGNTWSNVWVGNVTNSTMQFTVRTLPFLFRLRLFTEPMTPPTFVPSMTGIQPDGRYRLAVDSLAGQRFRVLATTDFTNWKPIHTNVCIGGAVIFHDPGPKNEPTRFYRAEILP